MDPQIDDLKEAIGRAIDAAGHARFLAQSIEQRTARPDLKEVAVKLLGVRKNLQGCEIAVANIEASL